MEVERNLFGALKEALPISYVIAVMLAFLSTNDYYRHYSINIVPYIDLSEVLLPFTSLFFVTLPIFVALIYFLQSLKKLIMS